MSYHYDKSTGWLPEVLFPVGLLRAGNECNALRSAELAIFAGWGTGMTARETFSRGVAVVGAGPVGLVLALCLGRQGIRCTVLESAAVAPPELRASTFHPPTLDLLERLELTAPLMAVGLCARTWQVRWHETHEAAVFDLGLLADDTRHPYRLQCPQDELVRLAERQAAELPGVQILRGARVLSMVQTDDGVRVGFEQAGQAAWLEADLLVGADGARSTVRSAVTEVFDGETYPETTLLATTRCPFEQFLPRLSPVNYLWWAEGTFSLLALPGLWRANFHLPPGTDLDAAARPEAIQALLERLVPGSGAYPVEQCRQYRIHRRIVDRYRRGRIVLAGDAAHLNSPAGGMGMNGGLHDAFELAATLAEIRDGASLDLLDRYARRRLPIARDDILRQADSNRARMQARDPVARRAALTALQETAADPHRAREHLLRTSMILGLRAAAAIA